MALGRFTHELVLDIASDSGGKFKEFARPRDTSKVDIKDVWEKTHGGNFTIATTTTETLDLGDVTSPAKGAYIEVDNDCDITFNGLASPMLVRRVSGQSLPSKIFLEVDITSISILAGANDVNGTYRVWGDEAPTP